jgi:monoamine oxidase
MIQYASNPAVVVIGAGAAGIGAGVALARLGVPHIILEAKNRIGGRAYSESTSLGHLWDHGCHWFHSANINVLRAMAEKLGHKFLKPRPRGSIDTFIDGKWTETSLREDYVWRLLGEIADTGKRGLDIAASELLDPAHRWYPVIRHWVKLMYSAEPEEVSTRDAGCYNDTGVNLAVEDGYGALIAKLARGLPIKLESAVTTIKVGRDQVSLETAAGTLAAKAVVLAVPARMLETSKLHIDPVPPAALMQAFEDVPMGWYEKIAIGFDRQVFDRHTQSYADIIDVETSGVPPFNFELHPFGRPIAITHIAGNWARELEQAGEAAMVDLALGALVKAFGAGIRKRVTKGVTTHWSSDPFINGAYACAKPGKADMRRHFAEPVHGRLFLAGEHTHPSFNATAHGAYESGIVAAHRATELAGYGSQAPDLQWFPA